VFKKILLYTITLMLLLLNFFLALNFSNLIWHTFFAYDCGNLMYLISIYIHLIRYQLFQPFRYCLSTTNLPATPRTPASVNSSSSHSTTPTGDYWIAPGTRCRQTRHANITFKVPVTRRSGCLSSNTMRPVLIQTLITWATNATPDSGFGTKSYRRKPKRSDHRDDV